MSGADSPVLATGDAGSARALNTLAAFISNATDLDGYMMHPVVTSKLGKGIILDAAPVATEKQCKHNLTADGKEYLKMKIVEAKAVLDVACKTDDTKLQYSDKTGVYSSNVDGWLAVRAFAEIWDAYDGAAQEIKSAVTNAAGGVAKKLKSAIPFDSYGETIEKPIGASMRASTLTFGDWLKDSVDLPLTAKLVKEVESNLGLTDEICTFKRAHLLRYPTKVGSLFKMHTDYGDFPTGQAPHITANVLISPSQVAEMQVAGFDESFKYTMPGSVGAFPSGLYHSSGRCDGRKVLLVLMWRLNAEKPAEKSDSVDLTEPSSSTEAAQASTVEVKPIIKPEPATTTGSAAVPPAEPPVAEPIAPPATVTPVTAAVDKPVLQPDLQAGEGASVRSASSICPHHHPCTVCVCREA
jgi:hypothetical protein